MSHIPNKKQEEAFKEAVKAIKKCKRLGLRVYGKQNSLVAYTKDADDYISDNDLMAQRKFCGEIPHLANTCLQDSGADDYPNYATYEDQEKHNPDNL